MKRKKRPLSLLEIVIVIFLITLITGTIGYNMKGTLDKGKAFQTEQAKEQLHDLLLMCLAEGAEIDDVVKDPLKSLKAIGFARNPDKLLVDGWGHPFDIKANQYKNNFIIHSSALQNYNTNKNSQWKKVAQDKGKEEDLGEGDHELG